MIIIVACQHTIEPCINENDIVSDYDEPPRPIGGFGEIQGNLKYPDSARKAGIEGRVMIELTVDETGLALDCSFVVVKAPYDGKSDYGTSQAAMNAIRTVRWEPAKKDGKNVKARILIPVIFRLK